MSKRTITLSIYFLLFFGVVGIWVWEIKQFDELLETMWAWEHQYDFANIWYSFKLVSPFNAAICSLLLGIGIFLKNRTGWILITAWFYYLCANFIRLILEENTINLADFSKPMFLVAIPVAFIILMNKYEGIAVYHRVESKSKVKLNFWSIGVGIALAALIIIKKNLLQQ